ncbi:unnamed protein product, partial [Phyllotreta striolata]
LITRLYFNKRLFSSYQAIRKPGTRVHTSYSPRICFFLRNNIPLRPVSGSRKH